MDLSFSSSAAGGYRGPTQRIRRLSEDWFAKNGYCPSCGGGDIAPFRNNMPVADFFCRTCREEYELKSQSRVFGAKVADGAYRTMMERLRSNTNPHLSLLHYDAKKMSVLDLIVIPKHFFAAEIIEQRKPLSEAARRKGWVGCNISLQAVPQAGRIFLVKGGVVECRREVLSKWQKTSFLAQEEDRSRGWLLSVMMCVERIKTPVFTLADAYEFEGFLARRFPANRHVRPKIRQQLQVLRDRGYLEFLSRGTYRLAPATAASPER